jgi:pyruvate/2-oxoglutarate dehydrogenase complex dihydrolipoamide acyltransferase (E2) component
MPHLDLELKSKMSSFRRIAIGTWKTTYDPSIYGAMTVKMDDLIRYMNEFNQKTGRHITITHIMAKAVASTLEQMPDANAILRFNRIYVRKSIGVFFQVALTDDETGELDLSGATIHDANQKSLVEIHDEFSEQVKKVRAKEDKELEGTRSTFKKIPFFLLNIFVNTLGFLLFSLNLNLKRFGVPVDPFGSAMVTNIGSLGLEEAYVPLVPYSRVPLLIATGQIKDVLVLDDGEVKTEKRMKLCATMDHRIVDGSHAAVMSRELRKWLEDPYSHFDDLSAFEPEQPPEEIETIVED